MSDETFLSEKLELKKTIKKGGFGIYSLKYIKKDEILARWNGEILTTDELSKINGVKRDRCIQIEEDLYLVPLSNSDAADCVNHSCNPNAGLQGQRTLVALRDISPGEEICYDYSMSDSSSYDEFQCYCNSKNCRGLISGKDWKIKKLWNKYDGYYSSYLQAKIENLKKDNK